jgi:hypothetical protein
MNMLKVLTNKYLFNQKKKKNYLVPKTTHLGFGP